MARENSFTLSFTFVHIRVFRQISITYRGAPTGAPVYTHLCSTVFPAYAFSYVAFARVSLPYRKQILIPRSLGPLGHHPRHSRVLPLFSVSRITPSRISRSSRNVIYTRRSLWRVSIFIPSCRPPRGSSESVTFITFDYFERTIYVYKFICFFFRRTHIHIFRYMRAR